MNTWNTTFGIPTTAFNPCPGQCPGMFNNSWYPSSYNLPFNNSLPFSGYTPWNTFNNNFSTFNPYTIAPTLGYNNPLSTWNNGYSGLNTWNQVPFNSFPHTNSFYPTNFYPSSFYPTNSYPSNYYPAANTWNQLPFNSLFQNSIPTCNTFGYTQPLNPAFQSFYPTNSYYPNAFNPTPWINTPWTMNSYPTGVPTNTINSFGTPSYPSPSFGYTNGCPTPVPYANGIVNGQPIGVTREAA